MNDGNGMVIRILEAQGRNRTWLARQIGVSPGHLTRMLNGERPWTEENKRRAAQVLGVPIEMLFEIAVERMG